jgi:CHAT domain-containing protein
VFAIGEAFYNADKPDSSVVFYQEALRISEQRYGPNSGQAMVAMTRLIKALFLQAEYTKGLELLNPLLKDQAALKTLPLAMQEKTFLLLAELTKITGETALNKMFLTKALSLQHKRQVPDVLLLAEAEEQYAYVYIENSNYYRAGKSLEKALSLKRKFLPEQSPLLISTYQQLASLRILTGDLQAADSYLSPLGSITQATFGKEAVKTAEFKLILAEYLISIADYKAAQKELKEADKILTSKLRASHLSRIPVLMAMASVLDKLGETPGSINENYQQAMKVVQLSIGKNTSLYAGLLKTYATWQIGQGKIKEALVSLGEAEKYWKQKSGQTLALAEISGLYGEIAFKSTTYSEALLHFRQAAEMYKNVFNEKHPRYTEMVGRCARMTYLTGDPDKAVALMEEIIPTFLEFTTTHFPVLSFRQKALYWSSIREEFEFFHNLAFLSKSSNPSLWSKALNYSMATKGILLSSNSKLLNQIYSSNDSLLIAQYHQWVSLKEELVSSIGLSKKELEESGIDRNDLETRIENQEKEMSTRSQLFLDNAQKSEVPGWKFIAQQLQPDEVVLEMIRFRKYVAGFTDSSAYAVLSFSKAQSEPSLVVLPNGFAMERRFLKYYRNATTGKMNDEFSYGTYWQPIKNAIEDGKHIYVSTDGVYTQLNIEMLRLADGSYAIDHNSFVYITTTRDLQYLAQERKGKTKPKKNNAEVFVVCGNPQFYSNSFSGPQKNIAALPGTAKEIEIIKSRWDAAGKTSKMFSDRYANEDTLKSIKNPVVLHIATHGMFKESKQRSKDDLAANPLLNCGILLSEAGDILDNKSNSYVNQKDGILTAFEAMDLPLDQTELVVLSACETGRGEVEAGEGVAGLQRSFLMAGSKAVVVSLFKVNDDVTQQLMDHFYNYWLSSGNKVWAFAEAKRTIKKEFRDPIYWGAFILVEGKPERVVNK